jgi:hypothetical protein
LPKSAPLLPCFATRIVVGRGRGNAASRDCGGTGNAGTGTAGRDRAAGKIHWKSAVRSQGTAAGRGHGIAAGRSRRKAAVRDQGIAAGRSRSIAAGGSRRKDAGRDKGIAAGWGHCIIAGRGQSIYAAGRDHVNDAN